MRQLIALLILGLVVVSAVDQPKKDDQKLPEKKPEQIESTKKRMAAVGPKDLDIKKIAGHWLQIGGSAALHKSFLEGCTCNQVDFKQLSEDKLHMMAFCKGKENKLTSVNGTLTMVKPQENKSLFNLVFTEKKGDVKGVEVNKTAAQDVKNIRGTGGAANDTKAKGDDISSRNVTETKGKDVGPANVVLLKFDNDSLVMGSPALDSAWILARKQLDDKKFQEYSKFLESQGFTGSKLIKISHDKCGDIKSGQQQTGQKIEKGKSSV